MANAWLQAGNVGNDGGGSNRPHGTLTLTDGWIMAQVAPHAQPDGSSDNFYTWQENGDQSKSNAFELETSVMFPTQQDINRLQALEFEMQQSYQNKTANGAWQVRPDGFYYFDYTGKRWLKSNIPPLRIIPGTVYTFTADFKRGSDGTMAHRSIAVNGQGYPVNISQPMTPETDYAKLNNAIQFDGNKGGDAYSAFFKQTLRWWTE